MIVERILVALARERDPVDRGSHCKVCLLRANSVCIEVCMQLSYELRVEYEDLGTRILHLLELLGAGYVRALIKTMLRGL